MRVCMSVCTLLALLVAVVAAVSLDDGRRHADVHGVRSDASAARTGNFGAARLRAAMQQQQQQQPQQQPSSSPVPVPLDDPASSWLAYTRTSPAHGGVSRVLSLSAQWVVPPLPPLWWDPVNGAPGYWFGIEPRPAAFLVQPILAWGDAGLAYTIFNGVFEWTSPPVWQQSASITVHPGELITASVRYVNTSDVPDTYEATIAVSPQRSIVTRVPARGNVFVDGYFVGEHQTPLSCGVYPSSNRLQFTDIAVRWADGAAATSVVGNQSSPVCDWRAQALSVNTTEMTWSSKVL